MRCKLCGGLLEFLGNLGLMDWFRCRHCGMEWSIRNHDEGTFDTHREEL